MPKRKNSSIKEYTLKSGAKRFEFVVSLGFNSNGKRVQVHRRGFKSYSEAEDAFNKLTQTKADDFVKQKQIKIDELWKIWFKHYLGTVKASTANKTQTNYRCHIKPYFGNNYIDNVTVKDLQLWADRLATKLVKYRDILFIMRSLYEYGMRLGYVVDNPINRIIIPKKTTRKRRDTEHNVYTKKELDTFLEVAKQVSPRVYAYFRLISSTGLRKGEALALTWKDIDLINDTITINKTLSYGLNNVPVVNSPKTKTSIRTVPLSNNLKKALLDYRKSEVILSDKIFHTRQGNYVSLSKASQWLQEVYNKDHEINEKFAQENKLDESYIQSKDLKRITLHGFRHTFATLLIANGAKPKTVQMLLGHSNIQMTLDIYTHFTEQNKEDAVASIKNLNL